jgi:hypothetical protein
VDTFRRLFPAQVRDKAFLHAPQAVKADLHGFGVFLRWPLVGGEPGFVTRLQMVAFQNTYRGCILSWRIDRDPNSTAVPLNAGDMIEARGIPERGIFRQRARVRSESNCRRSRDPTAARTPAPGSDLTVTGIDHV